MVQLNEMVKRNVKKEYGKVTGSNIDSYCLKNNICGSNELRTVRGDCVHSFCKLDVLLMDLRVVKAVYIESHLKALGVSVSINKIEKDLEDLMGNLGLVCRTFGVDIDR